jgi:hypothetical protein
MNHQSARFPQASYLTGVGESDSLSGAEAAAISALARIFHVQIEQKTAEWQSYLQVESRGRRQTEHNQSIQLLTMASTDKALEGAEIVETAQEKPHYYALAVIDRRQAKNRLTEQIEQLDRDAQKTIHLAREASVKLIKIRHYRRAIKTLMLREGYNADLAIVNLLGSGLSPILSTSEVVQELSGWLDKNFLIHIQIHGEESDVVQMAVIDARIQEGFPVGIVGRKGLLSLSVPSLDGLGLPHPPSMPDVLVSGEVRFKPVHYSGQSFQYVRWCVDLTVHEVEQDRIIGVATLSGREGHLSDTEAKARAIQSLLPKVTMEISGLIATYLSDELKTINNPPLSCVRG